MAAHSALSQVVPSWAMPAHDGAAVMFDLDWVQQLALQIDADSLRIDGVYVVFVGITLWAVSLFVGKAVEQGAAIAEWLYGPVPLLRGFTVVAIVIGSLMVSVGVALDLSTQGRGVGLIAVGVLFIGIMVAGLRQMRIWLPSLMSAARLWPIQVSRRIGVGSGMVGVVAMVMGVLMLFGFMPW
jgi:hypothetical protein